MRRWGRRGKEGFLTEGQQRGGDVPLYALLSEKLSGEGVDQVRGSGLQPGDGCGGDLSKGKGGKLGRVVPGFDLGKRQSMSLSNPRAVRGIMEVLERTKRDATEKGKLGGERGVIGEQSTVLTAAFRRGGQGTSVIWVWLKIFWRTKGGGRPQGVKRRH